MFHQLLRPVADNLALSFLTAALPIAVVLLLMGWVRRPAWQASLAGLVTCLALAILVWKMPARLALYATGAGAVFALWPVMWIVLTALLLYNIAVLSGRFDAFRRWISSHLPNDRRVVLVVVGFCFGALLEGVAGFGAPVAICSALLIATGFPALEALVFTLIFNTAPVAFGALGAPVTTLAAVTGLPDHLLGAMIGRQLPFIALVLPFYVMGVYGGMRSIKALWPLLLVAGGVFGGVQFVTSNYLNYVLTDVLSSIVSLAVTIAFLQVWKPKPDAEFALAGAPADSGEAAAKPIPAWQGWWPWIAVSVVVIAWTELKLNKLFSHKVAWPGLDQQVFITLYEKPYAAVWDFQPLATGTAILVSAALTAAAVAMGPKQVWAAAVLSWRQARLAVLTVMLIVGLAYLMNYSGMTYTLGLQVASVGVFFPLVSAFLGWVAVFLSGSDTSGNALFGNLQVVAANQLNMNPVLFAATNSSGGVMGKMISPQNISTGAAVTELKGQEGAILARTFKHSVILTLVLSLLVMAQQHLLPWMIPS